MKVLVGKTFGIGNAVLAIPMIRAIRFIPEVEFVDVMIGTYNDDHGAHPVLMKVDEVSTLYTGGVYGRDFYDVAVMSIPYDGRWKNGTHFHADKVIDGRTRPDPSTMGLVSWKKHEVEYQMDNAYELGYDGPVPSMCFIDHVVRNQSPMVYLGVGYKKDAAGFWTVKHWGNDCFIEFTKRLLERRKDVNIIATGDMSDVAYVGKFMRREIRDDRFIFDACSLDMSMRLAASSDVYVGNDTGMMHVAAAHDVPCIVPFFMENSITKNRPWGDGHVCIDAVGRDKMSLVDEIVEHTLEKLG